MFSPDSKGPDIRKEFNLDGKFVVTYAGALGPANDLNTLLNAADILKKDPDIHFLLVGDGMGRYTSLGLVRDAVLTNGEIETVKSVAASAAYRHVWNGKSSSNIIYSMADIDNPDNVDQRLNKSASSLTVNYLYRPIKNVTYGIMLMVADRELDNGDEGKMNRVQASAKYAF